MTSVIKTFISYKSDDKAKVQDLLDRIAPWGVRPWWDQIDLGGSAGLPIEQSLSRAISSQDLKSCTLMVSRKSMASDWVQAEIKMAKRNGPFGMRIIPIIVDQEVEFKDVNALLGPDDTLAITAEDPDLEKKWARAVFDVAGITAAEKIVLHLGYRATTHDHGIPPVWSQMPVRLDLRAFVIPRDGGYCPTTDEWKRIRAGLTGLHQIFSKTKQIHVCGLAPLGAAFLVGRCWDKNLNDVAIKTHNVFRGTEEIWETRPNGPSPTTMSLIQRDICNTATLLESRGEGNSPVLVTFLMPGKEDQLQGVQEWLDNNPTMPPRRVRCFIFPQVTQENVRAVVDEVAETIRRTKVDTKCQEMDLIASFPLALMPLVARELSGMHPIRMWDEVKTAPKTYRLVDTCNLAS